MNRVAALVVAVMLAIFAGGALANNLPDPTRPLSYAGPQVSSPELVLQAILKRESGPEAIVNGKRVKVGGTVDGARIEAIRGKSLTYSYGGEQRTLALRPTIQKQNIR